MIVAALLWKIMFPLIGISSVGYVGKYLYDIDWSFQESKAIPLVNIVGKVVTSSEALSTVPVVDMMKDEKPNYHCDLSTNQGKNNKAFCIIQKFTPTQKKVLNISDINTQSDFIQKSTDLYDNDSYFSITADSSKIKDFKYSASQKLTVFSKENDVKIIDIKILYTYTNNTKDVKSSTNLIIVKSENNASKYLDVIKDTTMCQLNKRSYKCTIFTTDSKLNSLDDVKKLDISTTRALKPKPQEDIAQDKYYIVDLATSIPLSDLKDQHITISAESKIQGNRIFRKPIGKKYEIVGYLTSTYQTNYQIVPFTSEKNTILMGEKDPSDVLAI